MSVMVTVRPCAPTDHSAVDAFLSERPEGLVYYSPRYLGLIQALCGGEDQSLLALRGETVVGFFPLLAQTGNLGVVLNSSPFYGSNGGAIGEDEAIRTQLTEAYNECARASDVVSSVIVDNPLRTETQSYHHTTTDYRIGQWTALPKGDDLTGQVMAAIHSSARRNIRKAEKNGVSVNVDFSAKNFLIETHQDNIRSIGGLAKDRAFFDEIEGRFKRGQEYFIYTASKDGELIGALLVLCYGQTAEYITPAIVTAHRSLQALPLIIRQAMADMAGRGYRWWNWGGTWASQDGVYRFKRKFGAEDRRYTYHVAVNEPSILSASRAELLAQYPGYYVAPFSQLVAA